jgi:hypothetical protein
MVGHHIQLIDAAHVATMAASENGTNDINTLLALNEAL